MTIDYNRWSATYDATRGASEGVLRAITAALGPPAGRTLLDIGCGTGNNAAPLAAAGFRVALMDHSPGMVGRAAVKLPFSPAVTGDGQSLPFRDAAFDCAIAVKVINHIPQRDRFLAEAMRVLRDGPLVLLHAARETIRANWICHYVPSLIEDPRYQSESQTVAALRAAGFSRVAVSRIWYGGEADGSAQALKYDPDLFLSAVQNTSLLHKLTPAAVDDVLAAVHRDRDSGKLADVMAEYEPLIAKFGDGSLFVARP
jgi:ubiquinone/menaquinone biosynthesis C-methylase UbiE